MYPVTWEIYDLFLSWGDCSRRGAFDFSSGPQDDVDTLLVTPLVCIKFYLVGRHGIKPPSNFTSSGSLIS